MKAQKLALSLKALRKIAITLIDSELGEQTAHRSCPDVLFKNRYAATLALVRSSSRF